MRVGGLTHEDDVDVSVRDKSKDSTGRNRRGYRPVWSSGQSCDRGFLLSFREEKRGSHDMVMQKPSFIFML
jgi:hypothetical protein